MRRRVAPSLRSHPIRKATISHQYFFSCVVRAQVERRVCIVCWVWAPQPPPNAADWVKCQNANCAASSQRGKAGKRRLIGISSPCTIRSSDSVGALMKSTLRAAHSRLLAHNMGVRKTRPHKRKRDRAEKIARYLILLRFAWHGIMRLMKCQGVAKSCLYTTCIKHQLFKLGCIVAVWWSTHNLDSYQNDLIIRLSLAIKSISKLIIHLNLKEYWKMESWSVFFC